MKPLVLVGSPLRAKSSSASLAQFLADRLTEKGAAEPDVHFVRDADADAAAMDRLLAALAEADLVVFSFPLYVDQLPAECIRVLERVAAHRLRQQDAPSPRFVAIANCGFPEGSQCQAALDVCRQFAREVGFAWAGGIAIGGGPMVDRKPLDEAGGAVRHLREALALAAEALAEGRAVPDKAVKKADTPPVPIWLYRWMASRSFKKDTRRNGVRDINARPYEESAP